MFLVRLRAKTTVIAAREEEDLGDRFAVRTVHAIPKEIHDELSRWRSRNWKRIKSRPTVQLGPLTLFPASEYPAVLRILEEAKREYEEIVAKIPDPEVRERFTCAPTIMFVTAAPGFEGGLKEEVSEQVLRRVEEALQRTVEILKDKGDKGVERRLRELEQALEERIRTLEGWAERVEGTLKQSAESIAALRSREFLETVKRLEALILAVGSSGKLGKRDVKRIKEALEAADKFRESLTPEARRVLDRVREEVEAAIEGPGVSMADAADRLARELEVILGPRARRGGTAKAQAEAG